MNKPAFQRTYLTVINSYGLYILLTVFISLGLLYDFTVPLFEKPDELKHFATIQFIQTRHKLPVVEAGLYKPWDQEGTQPPLYYIIAATVTSWLELSNFQEPPRNPHYADDRSFIWRERGNNNLYLHRADEIWNRTPVFIAARLARWLSLLAGLVTVVFTYLLAGLFFNSSYLALLSAACVAFIPQFLHVSSAITNDSLSVTLSAAALLFLATVIKDGLSMRYAVYLGIVLGLGAITKLSMLYLLPLTGLTLLLDLRHHRSYSRFFMGSFIIGGLLLLLSGWWYWRNWQLYGDFSALNAHLLYRGGMLDPRPTLAQIWQAEMTGLELSFWAAFGAGQIMLEPWLYTPLRAVKYVVGVGFIIGVWHIITAEAKNRNRTQTLILSLLTIWTIIIFTALLRWMQITPASWGRLLYPTLPALGVLAVWSLMQFERGAKLYDKLPLLLAISLLILSIVSPFRYLQAAYKPPPLLSEAQISGEQIERLDFIYDGRMRLIGYQVEKQTVKPGEWLPVTLYWQAIKPIDKNYSSFIHLLGQNNTVIGQVNSYPAGGLWPTSFLEPGLVLKDRYYIPVSAEAKPPDVIRLAMGIFEFEDPLRAAKTARNSDGDVVEPIVGLVPLLPHSWPVLTPTHYSGVDFGGRIRLSGYDWPDKTEIVAGEELPLSLYWETLSPPGENLNLFIHLVNQQTGEQSAGFDAPPPFPTSFWQPGYNLLDERLLSIPANLPPGDYDLIIGWYNLDSFARLSVNGDDSFLLLTVTVR